MNNKDLKKVVESALDKQKVPHVKLKKIGASKVDVASLTEPSKETRQEYWGKGLTYCAIILIIILVASIIGFIGFHGLETFTKDHVNVFQFLTSSDWDPGEGKNHVGAAAMIVTSFSVTLLAALVATPFAIAVALFMTEYSSKKGARFLQSVIELLVGIPSVVYGLLGIYLLNPFMYKIELWIFKDSETHQFTGGANLLSAVLVLAIMILPTVINISETSIRAVNPSIKAASLALGASHMQTIFRMIIPAAKSGIVTAIVLGVGRAIGEAMAITLVSGSSVNMPLPFNSVRFLTTAIVSEMGYSQGTHRQVLFTIGLVLFVFIMVINITLSKILKKGEVEHD